MKHLLVVAHGSRREASNEEVRNVTAQLKKLDSGFTHIEAAFLELAEPSIPDGLRKAIAAGASEIVVLPYFLSAGRHVSEDIPNEIRMVTQEHPEVQITLAPYLGSASRIPEILLAQAK